MEWWKRKTRDYHQKLNIRVASLITEQSSGFELISCRFELVSHGLEHVTRGFELLIRGFELVTL